ncbi:histidine phosphatase family protein [Deltaproteobacteria bacterium Smac51]|nr:histidine phosphatase family protein [Deltaproteobacteria bacterium Smac51]
MRYFIWAVMALMMTCFSAAGTTGWAQEAAGTAVQAPGDGQVLIYFVRSGRTFFQVHGRVQGVSNSPLTEEAVTQAKTLGKGMKDIAFTTAFSSDLGRHRRTARYILAENANPKPELVEFRGLRDWNYGGFEGSLLIQMLTPIYKKHNLEYDSTRTTYDKLIGAIGYKGIADAIAAADPLGVAENYDRIIARSKEAMDKVIVDTLAKGGGNTLVVSSGNELPTILTMLAPDQFHGENISDGSVSIVKYKNGKYRLEIVGDESYLNKGK